MIRVYSNVFLLVIAVMTITGNCSAAIVRRHARPSDSSEVVDAHHIVAANDADDLVGAESAQHLYTNRVGGIGLSTGYGGYGGAYGGGYGGYAGGFYNHGHVGSPTPVQVVPYGYQAYGHVDHYHHN